MTATVNVVAPERSGATPALTLRTDTAGEPIVSGTFVLERLPRPDERLGALLTHGTLALEVSLLDPDRTDPVECLTVELRDGDVTLATASTTGPFLHAALQAELDATRAREAMVAMLGEPTTLSIRATVRSDSRPTSPTRVQVDLGGVWSALDAAADETRRFLPVDLDNYLADWLGRGIVRVLEGSQDPVDVRPAFLKAARTVLDSDLVLTPAAPMPMTVTAGTAATTAASTEREVSASLGELVAPRISAHPDRHVHVLAISGGQLVPVPPVTSGRRRRGPGDALHVLSAGRILGLGTALRPEGETRPLPIRPEALSLVHDRPQIHGVATIALPDLTERRPGPVVEQADAPLWGDRWDSTRAWYLPTFRPLPPEPTMTAAEAPFRYELQPDVGHLPDGTRGLVATITVRLRPERSAATTAAIEAGTWATVTPVPLSAVTVQLAVPFRDQQGATQVELVTADDVQVDGTLGEDGSSLVATFRLIDSWARLAYGALSTPAFQTRSASVVVTAPFEGWSPQGRPPRVLGLDKRWALTGFPTRNARASRPTTALLNTTLVTAAIRPAWQFRPDLLDRLEATTYSWRRFTGTSSAEAFFACSDLGHLYREWRDEEWHAIGCRPALQLGQVEYRTYEPVAVAAAAPFAGVYRSLRSPGRFLVVPTAYAVGRYAGDAGELAYRPRMLLHSSVDDADPTDIRCVLAVSLEPVLPPYVRSAILAELRGLHPAPQLEYLPDTGLHVETRWAVPGATDLDCLPTGSGFDVVCTSDLQGFLALRSMLERGGLSGVAEITMPGGVRATSALRIGLAEVTGPFGSGPLELRADGEQVVVRNRSGQRVAVRALASEGVTVVEVGEVLDPGEELSCDRGGIALEELDVVHEPERGSEGLEEVRAYIEDLQVALLFLSTADPAAHGLAGLEIRTRFLGRDDPAPLVLTSEHRDGERSYVLPLTTFAADPVLEFTVVAVGLDGTREEAPIVSWPVRSKGALVPVGPPA